jgi:hypothetical protein
VMTLWKVTDLQGHNLMLSFYDQLKKGKRADEALRRAKLEYLDNALPGDQHPRYWAGYIFMGKPEFFAYSGGPLRIAGILAAMVVLLLTGRYLLKRSRSPGS